MDRIRIGTRGSPLALVQAGLVRDALMSAHDIAVEICIIKTTGDMIQNQALAEIGGKALWTKELDRALLGGKIDCAVHSMKDVETLRPGEITIAAMLPRGDVRDRIIGASSVAALRYGARVGTSSPRRRAQLLRLRPDLDIVLFRGNVDTRLARLEAGEADATLLASAGLERLGHCDIGTAIKIDVMLPAPAQGAVGIETRRDDHASRDLLAMIDHRRTHGCVVAERALLEALQAGCHSPVAALAMDDGTIRAELFAEDGSSCVEGCGTDPAGLARELLDRASESIRRLFVAQ